jgi:hypothetical protein
MTTYLRSSALAVGLLVGVTSLAAAQAQQTVTFEVQAINEIAVSGDPAPLVITAATAGQQPASVSDNSTTYSITTNESGKSIQAALDAAMPPGLTLTIQLAAPTGASSVGPVDLTTTAQNLVTGVSTVAESGLGITYTLSATLSAGAVPQQTRTVTLTIN